jgi:hypothetical protein
MFIKLLSSLIMVMLTLGCKTNNNTTSLDSTEYTQLQYYNSINLPYKNLYLYFSSDEIVATADDSGFTTQSKRKIYPVGTVDRTLAILQGSQKICYGANSPSPMVPISMVGSTIYIRATRTDGTVCNIFPNENDFAQLESICDDVLLNGDENLSNLI